MQRIFLSVPQSISPIDNGLNNIIIICSPILELTYAIVIILIIIILTAWNSHFLVSHHRKSHFENLVLSFFILFFLFFFYFFIIPKMLPDSYHTSPGICIQWCCIILIWTDNVKDAMQLVNSRSCEKILCLLFNFS